DAALWASRLGAGWYLDWAVQNRPKGPLLWGELYQPEDHGRLDIFKEQIISFRQWMAANGYRDRPLAVTEFGILLGVEDGYTPERVAQYLRESVSWLEAAMDEELGYPLDGNRLVQRWAWFSLTDRYFPASDLANLEADTITIVGQTYRKYSLSPQNEILGIIASLCCVDGFVVTAFSSCQLLCKIETQGVF
ncbi:MAG: hypothetical protein C0393_05825, partial [Anaerolinea sp.]|nr:hypothetical protein [Anaerolinea sp.]